MPALTWDSMLSWQQYKQTKTSPAKHLSAANAAEDQTSVRERYQGLIGKAVGVCVCFRCCQTVFKRFFGCKYVFDNSSDHNLQLTERLFYVFYKSRTYWELVSNH